MIIAVDFDGTLCENKFPDIGEPNDAVINALVYRKAEYGDKLILWTSRIGKKLYEAVEWCEEHGLEFNAINDNLPESIEWNEGENPRKIYADVYLDDKAYNISGAIERSFLNVN